MKKYLIIFAMAIIAFTGCRKAEKSDNPFFNEWDTPFGVPPFEEIRAEHFIPAYMKGFELHKAEIKAILNNPEAPTFENTKKELEYSGELLTTVSRVFGALNSANTSDSLQAINVEIAPIYSKHADDIMLNDTLFQRVPKL